MASALIVPLPDMSMEPVDTSDFADYLVESVGNEPAGRLADLAARRSSRSPRRSTSGSTSGSVLFVPWDPIAGSRQGCWALMSVSGPDSEHGTVRWADWLRTHAAE